MTKANRKAHELILDLERSKEMEAIRNRFQFLETKMRPNKREVNEIAAFETLLDGIADSFHESESLWSIEMSNLRLEERLERKEYEAVVKAIMRFRRKKHMTFRDESKLCDALIKAGVFSDEALEIVDVELQRKEDGL